MSVIYKGSNYSNPAASPPALIDQPAYGGKLRSMYDKFVLTADLAAGDTILMGGLLPEGATLQDCVITSDALGGACTVDVGWQQGLAADGVTVKEAAAATGFFAALPVSSAGVAKAHGNTYEGGGSGFSSSFYKKRLAAAVQPVIAEHAVSSGATGLAIGMEVFYIVD